MKKLLFFGAIYIASLVAYAIFSFGLTAPNLLLLSNSLFIRFQFTMWDLLFNDREMLAVTYLVIIGFAVVSYLAMCWQAHKLREQLTSRLIAILLTAAVIPLVFSSPALSYDVFNYIFNAKMVVIYQANPHQQVALDFAHDDWTRFMHNTHTPAPYGYGWTLMSLLPLMMGFSSFIATLGAFRLFSILSLALWFVLMSKNAKSKWLLFMTALNPLLLLEIVSNIHNDFWMMVPAIWGMILVTRSKGAQRYIASGLLLLASASIKFATLSLLPLWALLGLQRIIPKLHTLFRNYAEFWPVLASIMLFVPLLHPRSKHFLPWYLTWSLAWLPLFPSSLEKKQTPDILKKLVRIWPAVVLSFSFSGLLRYAPYLNTGSYTEAVDTQQLLITWVGGGALLILSLCFGYWYRGTLKA